jgi:hypothetical protein
MRILRILADPRTVMWWGFAVFVAMAVGVLSGIVTFGQD